MTTRVLCLTQMFSPDQLEDDEYYQKFCRRMTAEGQRSGGKLRRTVVPRPDPSGAPVAGVGKVLAYMCPPGFIWCDEMRHSEEGN